MTKNDIQQKAVKYWLENNKKGTLQLATGVGKTIASLHCLYTMPKKDGKVHLFLAETTARELDLKKDIELYNKLFNVNVLQDYNLVFKCYQAVHKIKNYEFGLVIGDEIHNSLSNVYSRFFFNNKYDAIVGLSATIDKNAFTEFNHNIITKEELLNKIAPVCFTYTLSEAQKDGLSRKLNIYVIDQFLNEKDKTILSGTKLKPFYQTEKDAYVYWEKAYKKAMFTFDPQVKQMQIVNAISKRSKVLYSMISKIQDTKRLLEFIKGKTIIFNVSLDNLLQVTQNVISSKNTDSENDKIRKDFDEGWINIIGSFKKLKQGANLKKLDNCIIMSYFSKELDIIQMLGRLRQNGNSEGNVFIFVTKNTQEEIWFNKMMENIINDFNIIYCKNIDEVYQKYTNLEN